MALHFLSVLGTSNYEPVSYDHQPVSSFVQIALLRKFHDQLGKTDSRITIFLTKKAKEANWDDRNFSEYEKKSMERWPESVKPAADLKRGLRTEIQTQLPELMDRVETVDIPDGINQNEIWEIFRKLYECIDENDQIIMDVTHSFRSIPILMIAALNYAGVMKKSVLSGIYYGAFEAAEKESKTGVKEAPIFDLTLYNDILRWTHAADTLRNYGNPNEISLIVEEKIRRLGEQKQIAKVKEWKTIRKYTSAMSSLADSLSACRGAVLPDPSVKKAEQKSISGAYAMVKRYQAGAENIPDDSKNIYPLYELLNEAEKSFEGFDVEESYQTGLAAVQWYIDNNMIQQGYTALEETAKTFICSWYHLDETVKGIRDDVAGHAMNLMSHYMRHLQMNAAEAEQIDRNKVWSDIRKELEQKNKSPEEKRQIQKIVMTLPFSYADIIDDIKDIRNDINHFGMRANPRPTATIKVKLKEDFESLKKEIAEMQASGLPRG